MHFRLSRTWRLRHRRGALSRLGGPAFGLACTAACLAPATAPAATSSAPMVTVTGSSVIVVNQPAGRATVTASRPDPLTGKPVVIGTYTGVVDSFLPFTVNTTPPSAGGGDCWQQGALASALTPDLLPGDTVTVTGAPGTLGGQPLSTSATVAPDAKPSGGPIPECASVAPFAQNSIADAPAQVTGGPITVSGRAQPLATGVSIAASDGTNSSPAASATPAADGTWSATIPAADVAALADGSLTLTPVVALPDIRTGVPAHIAAAPVIVRKQAAAVGVATHDAAAGAIGPSRAPSTGSAAGTVTAAGRVSALNLPARLSARTARVRGISASFVAPAGASTVQLQLLRGGRVLGATTVAAVPAKRQTVRLSSPTIRRLLRPGRYTLRVRAGVSLDQLGPPVLRGLLVR